MESSETSSSGGLFGDVEPPQKEGGLFDMAHSSNAGLFEGVARAPIQKKQDLFDVTAGSLEFGAADTAALLSRGLNRSLGLESSSLQDFSNSLEDFKRNHPEYAPAEVENTLDLLSNPKAISSRIFGSAAYTGMMMGSAMIPVAGWLTTALTAYGIESQRAYESAKSFGATEQEAETAARTTGLANSMFQVALSTRMLNVLKGEESTLAQSARGYASSMNRALGPVASTSADAAILGSINAMQGAIDDKIALDTYGKPFDSNFWDKRLQEGALGAATSLLINAPRTAVRVVKAIRSPADVPLGEAELNVFDRNTAFQFFNQNGVPRDTAKSMAAVADSMASQFAVDTGQPKESFFPSVINDKNFELKSNGAALQQNLQTVFDSFDRDPATAIKTFLKSAVNQFPADKVESLKESIGVTDKTSPVEADQKLDSALMRYLWEGESVSPETAAPLEDIKQLLRDTYKNVTTLGAKKISPETKVILDSMLAPETDEITATRKRLENAKTEIDKNFPEEFKPSSLLTDEDFKTLMEPIREEKVSHDFGPSLEVTKETKETVIRPRTRAELAAKMEEILASKSPTEKQVNSISEEPLGMVEGVPRTRAEASLLVEDLTNELDRLRMGRLQRDDLSGVERRSESGGWLRDRLLTETPGDAKDRLGFIERMRRYFKGDSAAAIFDQQAPLRRFESGRMVLDTLQEVKTNEKLLDTPLQVEASKRSTSLNWRERKWLGMRDAEGFTNLEKIIDQTLVGDNNQVVKNSRSVAIPDKFQNVKDFRNFAWGMNSDYARIATRQGQLMRFTDGKWRPFEQPESQRFLRLHTDEFRRMAANPSGQEWKQFLEYIKTLPGNESLAKMKTDDLSKAAQQVYHDSELRTNSALEAARIFKVVPSEVSINGRKVQIFETDPLAYLQRASRVQANRLAWGKVVGQDVLSKVQGSSLAKVAKVLEVEPLNDAMSLVRRIRERLLKSDQDTLQENLQKSATRKGQLGPPNSAEATMTELLSKLRDVQVEQSGPKSSQEVRDPLSDSKALSQALRIAKDLKINLRPSRQDYLDAINSVTATNMTAKQAKSLKTAARQLEGVNTELPPHELLSEIKSRLNEDTFSGINELLNRVDKESFGHARPFAERVIKEAQGIPTTISAAAIPRNLKAITSLLGTSMTVGRAILHIAQPLLQVAPDAGLLNYIKSMSDVLLHHGLDEMRSVAAIPESVHSWGFEKFLSTQTLGKALTLENLAKTSRALTNKTMGINAILNFNNLVAGQAYRRYAQGLMSREMVNGKTKVTSSDVATLKGLGLNPKEISEIQSGQMSKIAFAKIVQNGVERLGTNLPRWKMGTIESSPIGRMLFAFSSYAVNEGRLVSGFFHNNIIPAIKSKDPATMLRAVRDTLGVVGAALGAGAVTEILYNIPRGSEMRKEIKDEDESILHRAAGAMLKVAFVGPPARFIESLNVSGPNNVILGTMPYLHSISKLIGLFYNEFNKQVYGQASEEERYGRYGLGRNIQEYTKSLNPAIREFGHTLDNAKYPDKPAYDETRAATAKYKERFSKTISSPSPSAVDPMKDQVFFYVQRNDLKGAMDAAQQYYIDYFDQMSKDPHDAIVHNMGPKAARESLRGSLLNRAPIQLTEREKLDFLAGLPADQVRKYYITDLQYRSLVNSVAPRERK